MEVIEIQHQCQILIGSVKGFQGNLSEDNFTLDDSSSDEVAR